MRDQKSSTGCIEIISFVNPAEEIAELALAKNQPFRYLQCTSLGILALGDANNSSHSRIKG